MSSAIGVLIALFVVSLTCLIAYLCSEIWLKPRNLRKKLQQQGINSPPPSFFYGNIPDITKIRSEMVKNMKPQQDFEAHLSHDYMSYLFPHLSKWKKDYGSVFAFTLGNMVIVYMSDYDLVADLCRSKSIEFGKPSYSRKTRGALLGSNSILTANGTSWVHQRKIIAPEFFPTKLKDSADMMVESAVSMLKKWEAEIVKAGGIASIKVDEYLKNFTAEVFSKTCFGSSYAQGNKIFTQIGDLIELISRQFIFLGLPGFRYVPIKSNREVWRLGREINNSIMKLMKDHELSDTKEDDFLQALMNNFNPHGHSASKLIVDNCKAMFFAGHETTATAADFALVLLAAHPEWQNQVRDEVVEITAGQVISVDMLHKMKKLTMVIYETFRLYPASLFMPRETTEDMKFGNVLIPKGVNIWIPVAALHQDPENWGTNAGEFYPGRFENGISNACKLPHLYMPFGVGLRTCVGQNYAMIELKIVLSLILLKFTFSLAPDYKHCIVYKVVSAPENGVTLLMQRIVN